MKKAKHGVQRQQRRQRALDRFTISPPPKGADPNGAYAKYLARKNTELAALKSALSRS